MSDLFGNNCPHCGQPIPEAEEQSFTAFWADTPHKIGKEQARKAWNKLTTPEKHQAHKNVKAFYGWFKSAYPTASALHPSTYLNGKRWQDEALRPVLQSQASIDRAAFWADQINAGRRVARSYAGSSVWAEILDRGLVPRDKMRSLGLT